MHALPTPRPALRLVPSLPTILPTPLRTTGATDSPSAVVPPRQARAWTVEVLRLVALRLIAGTPPTAGLEPRDDVAQVPVWREPGDPVLPGVLYVPLAAQFAAQRAAGRNPFTVLPSSGSAAAS
ncbi:hypothetical protein [Lapillicoccus jejuensis]|uniref:Uncharacterized protein n=1 Tax=Lapillicoccus jejuensis TaxID=402171 RepID=A0A542E0Y4_9MICO|nr:hypothetical protein [Lapillicoccus jejuensis]TQJ08939.1 hypothetical protein FB458_2040 [Lapillicoccus jejuensis]